MSRYGVRQGITGGAYLPADDNVRVSEMDAATIKSNVKQVLDELNGEVRLAAAVKTRSVAEIQAAIDAGVTVIGHNYVQEARRTLPFLTSDVECHFIGHLQKNKVKKAVRIFDVIETVDSFPLAEEIDRRSGELGRTTKVLVEVNSGREERKFGVFPEHTMDLVKDISRLPNIKVSGLMTMGPYSGDPELARPFFSETRRVFERIREDRPDNVDMRVLSMGMTNSYRVAVEEGANLVRIGAGLFGPRDGQ
jgi:hypothetical protein